MIENELIKTQLLLRWEFLNLDAKWLEKESKTCRRIQPIYLFEWAAQNGKFPPQNMRTQYIL